MILVTVGSQKFQFNRLLEAVDNLIEKGVIQEDVFAQTGYCTYVPKHYPFRQFFNTVDFNELLGKADIMVTHAGTGVIIKAVKLGKRVIAVPRKKEFGEHVDDHQQQIVDVFTESGLIYGCKDCSELETALREVRLMKLSRYVSCTDRIIDSIDQFIQEC